MKKGKPLISRQDVPVVKSKSGDAELQNLLKFNQQSCLKVKLTGSQLVINQMSAKKAGMF